MKAYSVLDVIVKDESWVPAYMESVGDIVSKHGGVYLANSTNYEFVEGSGNKEAARVIIEWPSVDAGKAFMSDPAYLPHLKARQAGTISNHFLIEGKA
ncbi:DUF1330 domain-containing protein [Alteromonas sp. KS69]|jgi:uncharacterized protein (DUF1330 family)|uniref:DUF1330 domain-containing protein n=1 Tax=Alteromonas naphthalenivorans TaxID=715451 RepID=F5ZGD2_ALTNA|nr:MULTISPECIES: DUF1330 domain-containing protein [Alteromonas]MBB68434.1 DUF1330 domain-containing protein [Rickettsiales bacterium]PHS57581.1 MAG: DUF1330 domain-containing protein [Alteromonas sp.]AEF05900.1 hypothetical protein ambt_22065 [Alteromonas naphthalenivorans]MBO7921361.1 DUF1330 domain-containing protein [Alteromonas sp. K632G]RUP83623.1 DUF1330 domain-containing protein [Alteromonas sp. KS69]|tara:strand:+ start:2190 stop:2483 length:294 start_codon:yes stop_codon:yes gene_type:complete